MFLPVNEVSTVCKSTLLIWDEYASVPLCLSKAKSADADVPNTSTEPANVRELRVKGDTISEADMLRVPILRKENPLMEMDVVVAPAIASDTPLLAPTERPATRLRPTGWVETKWVAGASAYFQQVRLQFANFFMASVLDPPWQNWSLMCTCECTHKFAHAHARTRTAHTKHAYAHGRTHTYIHISYPILAHPACTEGICLTDTTPGILMEEENAPESTAARVLASSAMASVTEPGPVNGLGRLTTHVLVTPKVRAEGPMRSCRSAGCRPMAVMMVLSVGAVLMSGIAAIANFVVLFDVYISDTDENLIGFTTPRRKSGTMEGSNACFSRSPTLTLVAVSVRSRAFVLPVIEPLTDIATPAITPLAEATRRPFAVTRLMESILTPGIGSNVPVSCWDLSVCVAESGSR